MEQKSPANPSMTLTAAISMGVGAMVGAGIFALMGEAGAGAGSAVYISFILGGVVSMLSAYSYAKLGVRYPSSGGIVEYLVQGYGSGYVTGIVSLILYFSVVVVMGMVAKAFGAYAAALIARSASETWVNVFASSMVITLTLINFIGSNVVGRVEKFIVIGKLSILSIFIVTGIMLLKPQLLFSGKGASQPLDVLSTVAICLLAYHGFGVITNTVDDMANPSITLPRALYGAVGIVMIVYVGAAISVFGNLPLSEILRAKDYAMAEAARPAFGQTGFTIISVAALMSAASSVNANLYSTAKMTFLLAKDGELPFFETKKLWRAGTGGLLTTAVLVLLIANLLDLSRIASLGSIVYLIVYSIVHLGHLIKLTTDTAASKVIVGLALATNCTILLIFGFQTMRSDPLVLYILGFLVLACFAIEVYMQKVRNRTIKPSNI